MISNEIDLVINTVEGLKSIEDSFSLRQTALLKIFLIILLYKELLR